MDALQALALDMRKRALHMRERHRIGRAVELEQFAARLDSLALPPCPPPPAPLERLPFAVMCHTLADRCADILRNDDAQVRAGAYERLRDADRVAVSRLRAYAHGVGDEADAAPELFKETHP